jgi:hypothetical protein
LARLSDKVHPELISEVVHLVVAPPDVLLLCIHHVRESQAGAAENQVMHGFDLHAIQPGLGARESS